MNNTLKFVKKGVSIAVTSTTILWSVGIGALAPLATHAAQPGQLIKGPNASTVYYLGSDSKRYVFPNPTTYFSWYADFSGVVTVSQSELESYSLGGNVTIRPGTKLVKITTDPKTYAVEPGGQLRHITSEAIATTLYGSNVWGMVVDVPDYFFTNYKASTNPISTNTYPTGQLIKSATGTDIYYVDGSVKKKVISSGLTGNMFNTANVVTAPDSVFNALSAGTDIAAQDSAIWNVQGGATTGPPTGDLTVSLSATTPAPSTLVAGQARADLAHFTFTGTGTVTNLVLQRIGLSSDTTLSALYLYDGATRLTDSASVSLSTITFNDSAGLFTVSGSKTISVQANVATSTTGQTVGVKVESFKMGTIVGTGTVQGNLHTIAAVSDLATLDFTAVPTPAASTISPQDGYIVWQATPTVGSRTINLKSISFRQIGSINTADIKNFRLYIDGVQKGNAIESLNSNGYVVFDFSSAPVALATGGRQIRLMADVIGGSSRNFSFSLQQASDVQVMDSQYNVNILATVSSGTFSARTTGTQTIDTGSLTIVKQALSPAGNITISASNQVYGKFDVKAYGERMKVESLQVAVVESDSEAVTLRNGALYLDGAQVGSTTAISDSSGGPAPDYTEYTFGSSFIVAPGTPRVLEIRADVFDSDGTNNIEASDTHQIVILAGSSNVQRLTSLGYGSYPAANVTGNSLTVSTGALTVAPYTSYSNHSVVVPKTAYKIGAYTIQANTTEGATITSLVYDFDEDANAFLAASDLTSLYITVGTSPSTVTYTSPVKSSVTATANTFTTNLPIATGQVLYVNVYADVASGASNGGTDDTGETSLTVSYTTTDSATSTSAAEVDGQTITFVQSGTFATALDGSSPLIRIVAGNQLVNAAAYEFTAVNETYYISQIQVKVASAAVASVVNTVQLYDGTTPVGAATPLSQSSNTAALITGLLIPVAPGTPKVITAKLNLNAIGAGAGTSGSNAALTLDYVVYADSNGVLAQEDTDRAGNALYVYRAIPTATFNSVTTSDMANGAQYDLYSFKVAASDSAPLYLKQLKLSVNWSDVTADTLEVEQLKLYENNVDITDRVVLQDEDGNSVESTSGLLEDDGTLVIAWAAGQQGTVAAGASNTYVIKGVPTGFAQAGTGTTDSVTFQLIGDSAVPTANHTYLNGTTVAIWGLHDSAAATGAGEAHNMIWSDGSANPHANNENASSSADWFNGYKVLNLDLNTVTWSKKN